MALLSSDLSHEAHMYLWRSATVDVSIGNDQLTTLLAVLQRRNTALRELTVIAFPEAESVPYYRRIVKTIELLTSLQSLTLHFLYPELVTSSFPPLAEILESLHHARIPPSVQDLILQIPISNTPSFLAIGVLSDTWGQLTKLDLWIERKASMSLQLAPRVFPKLTELSLGHWDDICLFAEAPLQRLVVRQTSRHSSVPYPTHVTHILKRFEATLIDLEVHEPLAGGPTAFPVFMESLPGLVRLFITLHPIDHVSAHFISPKVYNAAIIDGLGRGKNLRELYLLVAEPFPKAFRPDDWFEMSPSLHIAGYALYDGTIPRPVLYVPVWDHHGKKRATETPYKHEYAVCASLDYMSTDFGNRRVSFYSLDPHIPPLGKYPRAQGTVHSQPMYDFSDC